MYLLFLGGFFVDCLGFSMWTALFLPFLICMPFISVSCIMTLVRTSTPLLHKSGESRHSCLVPTHRETAFSLSPLSIMLAVGFFVDALWPVG